jgi:hypothetical protein
MEVPYLHTGRTNQKARTKDALIAAARRLLAEGVTPTLEEAAAEASIGRTTAYRYFPNSRALLAATYPEIEMHSLLGPDPPEDPLARLEILAESQTRQLLEYEPELRVAWPPANTPPAITLMPKRRPGLEIKYDLRW